LTLVNTNGDEFHINCAQVPPRDGMGTLEIPGVEVVQIGSPPFYVLKIPISLAKPGPDTPEDIKVNLQKELDTDDMVLPYDGGVPYAKRPTEFITVKVTF
jgi:hypothetical protein